MQSKIHAHGFIVTVFVLCVCVRVYCQPPNYPAPVFTTPTTVPANPAGIPALSPLSIQPNPVTAAPNQTAPSPLPSLWNWNFIALGKTLPNVIPNIDQQLFEEIQVGSTTQLRQVSQTHWGLAPSAGIRPNNQSIAAFSAIQKKGDAVINVEGGDLILAAQTRGTSIRLTTTSLLPAGTIPPLPPYDDSERVTITPAGNVGIGTTNPLTRLQVRGNIMAGPNDGQNPGMLTLLPSGNGVWWNMASIEGGSRLVFSTDNQLTAGDGVDKWPDAKMTILANGNVGIGVANPQKRLVVNGEICATDVHVTLSGDACWPDFVFDKGYRLPPLSALERSIRTDGHLPGMPSAADVVTQGVDVGQMQSKLLQQLEELTLHVIELEKQVDELKAAQHSVAHRRRQRS